MNEALECVVSGIVFLGVPLLARCIDWYSKRELRYRFPKATALRLPAAFTKPATLEVVSITHVGGSGMACSARHHCAQCHAFWRGDLRQCSSPHCKATDMETLALRVRS